MTEIQEALSHWKVPTSDRSIERFGSGHIHKTFLVKIAKEPSFILQELNTEVFKNPGHISSNIRGVAEYLERTAPDYLFPAPILTNQGEEPLYLNGKTWRLTRFIPNSYSPNELSDPDQAFKAARAFGELTRLLDKTPMERFAETIPDFHNLRFRFQQFQESLEQSTAERRKLADELTQYYLDNFHLVETYDCIVKEKRLPLRIQHHDTKINNILFDKTTHKTLAICDLDTLMPGYFISDLGDMIRTYTSAENEESTNWDAIKVRPQYLKALLDGYLSEMEPFLTTTEKQHLSYAGEFMIYMQGLRFLADYLNGDIYYPVKYDLNNFNRAKNQMILLEDYRLNCPK